MAFLDIKTVYGISGCVPARKENIADIYKWEGAEHFTESTGIVSRRRADDSITASDLNFRAAESLISSLGWEKLCW